MSPGPALINALLICAGVFIWTFVFVWELAKQPGYLKSWLVWSGTMGGLAFVAMLRSGATFMESLAPFVFLPVLIAAGQLRYRMRERFLDARAAREANYDAWGNPRPRPGVSKPEAPKGG